MAFDPPFDPCLLTLAIRVNTVNKRLQYELV